MHCKSEKKFFFFFLTTLSSPTMNRHITPISKIKLENKGSTVTVRGAMQYYRFTTFGGRTHWNVFITDYTLPQCENFDSTPVPKPAEINSRDVFKVSMFKDNLEKFQKAWDAFVSSNQSYKDKLDPKDIFEHHEGVFDGTIDLEVEGPVLGAAKKYVYVGINKMKFHRAAPPPANPYQPEKTKTDADTDTDFYDIEFSDDDDQNTTLPSSVPPSEPPAKKLKVGNGFNITDEVSGLQGSFKVTRIYPSDFADILIKQHRKILSYRPITLFLSDSTNHGSVTLTSEDVKKMLDRFNNLSDYSLELKLKNLVGKFVDISLVVKQNGTCRYWSIPNPEKLL